MDLQIRNASGERLEYAFAPGLKVTMKKGWLIILGMA